MMRSTPSRAGFALLGAAALALTACGEAPDEEESNGNGDDAAAQEEVNYTACVVSDDGGWNDQSFNQSAYEGLMNAVDELNIDHADAESSSSPSSGPTWTPWCSRAATSPSASATCSRTPSMRLLGQRGHELRAHR